MADDRRGSAISYPGKPDVDHRDEDGHLVMPPQLAALSDEDYANLGRRATLKMDFVIMPCMVIMYILNYLDRQNIASAKLAYIEEDLSLNGVQYQTSVSILFVGYSTFWLSAHRACHWDTVKVARLTRETPHSFDAGAVQHDCWQSKMARYLYLWCNGSLGRSLGSHGIRPKLRGACCVPFLYWIRRGSILPGCTIFSIIIL